MFGIEFGIAFVKDWCVFLWFGMAAAAMERSCVCVEMTGKKEVKYDRKWDRKNEIRMVVLWCVVEWGGIEWIEYGIWDMGCGIEWIEYGIWNMG